MNSSPYGDNCADFYDEVYGPPKVAVVRTLTRLARGGSVLELGLATGRTALALLQSGLKVTGIESSAAMLDILRRKSNVDGLRVVEGDFATTCLPEQFDLVFALVNTFCLLETRRRQERCLENIAQMLKSNGVCLLEIFRPFGGQIKRTDEGIRSSFHTELNTNVGRRIYKGQLLYPEVEALDALASNAGLELKERFADWRGSPYRPDRGNHVSLYGLAQFSPLTNGRNRR